MFNVIELQDKLKNFSQDQLANEMQSPSGNVPQYLVLSEFNRRKRVKDDYQQQQNAAQQNTTVAEEVLAGAGVPQGGLASLARNMAPKTDMLQNTGAMPEQTMPMPQAPLPMAEAMPEDVMGMAGGGYVKRMQIGGTPSPFIPDSPMMLGEGDYRVGSGRATMIGGQFVEVLDNGMVVDARTGMPVDAGTAAQAMAKLTPSLSTDTSAFEEFEGTPSMYRPEAGVPSQEDLDLGFISDARNEAVGIGTVLDSMDTPPSSVDFDATVAPPMSIPALPSSVPSLDVVMGDEPTSYDLARELGGGETLQAPDMEDTLGTSRLDALARAGIVDETVPFDRPSFDASSEITPFGDGPSGNPFVDYLKSIGISEESPIPPETLKGYFTPDPLMPVGEVPNVREQLESEIAQVNQQISDAVSEGNEILAGTLQTRKDALMRRLDLMELNEDASETLRGTVSKIGQAPEVVGGFINENVVAPFNPELAAENLESYRDMDEQRKKEAQRKAESEAAREERIEELRGEEPQVSKAGTGTVTTDVTLPSGVSTDSFTLGTPTTQLEEGQLTFGQPVEDQPVTPAAPTTTTRGGSGAGARGAATSVESEILNMLKEREERASSDKWLALAKAGMALMSSKNPTLLGALGEAGNVGLEALNKTRDDYEAAKFDLLTMQQKMAAARAKGSSGKGNAGLIDDIRQRLNNLYTEARSYRKIETDALGNATLKDLTPIGVKTQIALLENQLNYLMGGSPQTTQFDATAPIANAADSGYSLGTPVE